MLSWGGALGASQPNPRRDQEKGCNADQNLLNLQRKEELILSKQVRQGTVVILGGQNIRVSETRHYGDTRGTEYQGK